uniref:Uncharacterized protein n=1 Tax=Lepeophtheirus salmonis TaxID=72036 RepID=A0A0K2T2Y0_LEPSM
MPADPPDIPSWCLGYGRSSVICQMRLSSRHASVSEVEWTPLLSLKALNNII